MKMYCIRPLAILAIAVLPLGCQEKETAPTASSGSGTVATTAPVIAPTSPGSGNSGLDTAAGAAATGGGRMMGGAGGAPMMGGRKKISLAEATAEAPKDDATLTPLAGAFKKAEAHLKQAPNDVAAKKAFVDAAYKFGYAAESSAQLSSPVKYRSALYLYRKALAVDPQHAESLKEKAQIEQIYASMPGGVPTE